MSNETKDRTRIAGKLERVVMWFCSKKKEVKKAEPDWRVKALEECKDFRPIGDIFYYMGVKMLVTDHGTLNWHGSIYSSPYISPNIHANYINKHGEVKNITIEYAELETLRRQNTT